MSVFANESGGAFWSLCASQTSHTVAGLNDVYIINLSVLYSYRKIPGDKCEGGVKPERKEIDLSKKCVSDLMGPELTVSTSFRFHENLEKTDLNMLFY